MLFGLVLLSPIRSKCSKIVCLYKVFAVTELLSFRRLHTLSTSHCGYGSALKSSAHRFGLKAQSCLYRLTVCDMQPASISYGKETPVIASDDDEEEVQQSPGGSTVSVSSPASTKKKRKRKRGDIGGRLDSEEVAEKKKKNKESQRPNYFVSIPITNTQISSAVIQVQEAVLQQEPRLAKAMIPVPTLHITLLVTHLASQEQVDLAATVLAEVESSLAELLCGRDLLLPFSGIGHFRKEVVFVGLAPGQHRHTLDSLAELLRSRFEEQGLLQEGNRGFEPHITIMKLSRASKLRSQGIKRVDPALYCNYTNKFFGDQTVERVDLCSMLKKKQQDGYYHTETSLQLGGRRRSEPDEAELLRVSRRLVEDAVNRALQQYKQETLQNGGGPNATALQPPGNTEETATKTDTTANSNTDNRK
ncbi:A-kinase anchor protein 7 isoform X2 [Cottoperca gobio]|uniref:A-kinase anchor protein 7 isoform X2 n=1 Tax=Cottoperca gobio TaxID=56716 RepID=A0A6J2P7A5_COTGO|nr:A-kinase anchoring protein 7 isoform X2 [Cottoperca gobio]